jgi:hypothetical protein
VGGEDVNGNQLDAERCSVCLSIVLRQKVGDSDFNDPVRTAPKDTNSGRESGRQICAHRFNQCIDIEAAKLKRSLL